MQGPQYLIRTTELGHCELDVFSSVRRFAHISIDVIFSGVFILSIVFWTGGRSIFREGCLLSWIHCGGSAELNHKLSS